ncbi:MAG: alpha-L-fucosidase [Chitinophagaceae bacterium]|nr:alpha-L-fucosidase [Chitinophagaceae bacterium]
MQHAPRMMNWLFTATILTASSKFMQPLAQVAKTKTDQQKMQWWREARFGLFIHWGLYAVPAGEWNGNTNYGEWIRNNAQIPLGTYDKFISQFNPTKFNADDWVRMAKEAGMKYLVITTKHHDGFAIWPTATSDFNVMSTPFKKDPLKDLADACHKYGVQLCFYYSIMDWHHPDYLPRRDWETDRSSEGADFSRYVDYMKAQLKELLTNYGKIGVLWFDGEWEDTWTHEQAKDLYSYVKSLQPDIIVNNRIDKGRGGMSGFNRAGDFAGDFGTPEQEVPATGFPGLDWESCMTMNGNWGYNSHDQNWKSSADLVRTLIETASKGGNLLLNVGPTADGVFPQPSIDRLHDIGTWMSVNSASIYNTQASPFKNIDFGYCTQQVMPGGTRLYFQVTKWPADGKLVLPAMGNTISKAYTLAEKTSLKTSKANANSIIDLQGVQQQPYATVIVAEIKGKPVVYAEPVIEAPATIFIDQLPVNFKTNIPGAIVYYTTNGKDPANTSAQARSMVLRKSATIKAACFLNGKQISTVSTASFEKVTPVAAQEVSPPSGGLQFASYEGKWDKLPDFSSLSPAAMGTLANFDISMKRGKEEYAFVFDGWIRIPLDGVYTFYLTSDDGSRMFLNDQLIVDNDGLHGEIEKAKDIALAKGYHKIKVQYFERSGTDNLEVSWKGPGIPKMRIPDVVLYREN